MNNAEARIDRALAQVRHELERAMVKHAPMHSAHEGHSVIREEFEEFWEEVRRDNLPAARTKVVQLAAMAVLFLVDLPAE